MKKEMYRQGDLLFIKVDKEPIGNPIKSKDILNSSVTGHAHSITKGIIYVNEDVTWRNKGNFYLEINEEDTKVIHEEHGDIPLSIGIWEVRRQMEVNGYVRD